MGMELEEMLGQLHTVGKAGELEMKAKKTTVMTNRTAKGETLNCVPEHIYLGQVISFDRTKGRDIKKEAALHGKNSRA